ncbi:MAG: hypothetical protein IPM64_10190 [Phycisphaerales bacterium]|nr:hypothetical protein [Phycisphaerales bacterium]
MRILILQVAPQTRARPLPRFDARLGTLLTLLAQRGHELHLIGLSRFDELHVKAALTRCLPQLVFADISPVCVGAARRTLEFLGTREFLPIVAGGAYPTVAPADALSLPGVTAVAIGEPDATLVTYFERLKDPVAPAAVRGVWLRDEQGLTRPQLPALVEDLDSLPFAERELFGCAAWLERTGELEIAVGRGCPQRCGYCPNDAERALYEGRGTWVRRRSPGNVLDEIAVVRDRHATVRSVRILDHAFALDDRWLGGFCDVYAQRCGLPLRCHLRANAITAARLDVLRRSNLREADVEVISGSDFIRNEIFAMELSNGQIHEAFCALHAAGVATRAVVYLGSPYESEASMEDTLRLLRRLRPTRVDVRPYYPFPGTRAATDPCQNNGWLCARGEEEYHADRPGIEMPACRPALVAAGIRRIRAEFSTESSGPWWRRLHHAPLRLLQLIRGR